MVATFSQNDNQTLPFRLWIKNDFERAGVPVFLSNFSRIILIAQPFEKPDNFPKETMCSSGLVKNVSFQNVRGILSCNALLFASPRRISFIVLLLAFFHVYSVPIQEKVRILNSCPNEKIVFAHVCVCEDYFVPDGISAILVELKDSNI